MQSLEALKNEKTKRLLQRKEQQLFSDSEATAASAKKKRKRTIKKQLKQKTSTNIHLESISLAN